MATISERLRATGGKGQGGPLKAEAADVIDALVAAGAALSNCAYNLAQNDSLLPRGRASLQAAYKDWDAALAMARK